MGGGESKTEQLSEIINKQTIDISTSSQFNAHVGIEQDASIVARKGAKIDGASIIQYAKANLTALKSEEQNFQFMSDLQSKIKAELDSKKSDLGIGNISTNTIKTIVDNSVEMNYNTNKLETLSSQIKQKAKIIARDEGSSIQNAMIDQQADSFMKFVNNASMDMATKLVAESESENKAKVVTTNPVADVLDSVGGIVGTALGGVGDIFGMDDSTVIMIIIVVLIGAIISAGGYYMYQKQQNEKKTQAAQQYVQQPYVAQQYVQPATQQYAQPTAQQYAQPTAQQYVQQPYVAQQYAQPATAPTLDSY